MRNWLGYVPSVQKHQPGCWDIYTLYPICWWVSCSMSFLFSSYVERQMYDWIYECPREYRAEMWIVVWWKCYVWQHFAPCTVGQPRQISSRRLICFMIMVHSQADWRSFSLESLKWNWSSHAQVKLQTHSSLRNSLSHPTAHFQTSPAHFPFSSLSRLSPRHLHTHNHTTLILFHHSCFPPLPSPPFPFTICICNVGDVWQKFYCWDTAPLCFVSYILIFIIQNCLPYSCSYPSSFRVPHPSPPLTEVGLHCILWTQWQWWVSG